jgi:N-acetylmuramoyl-L-alanine amidase
MTRLAALAVAFPVLYAQTVQATQHTVTGVRHWEVGEVTRVAVEVSGDFETRSDRLHDPERLYFDILSARPLIHGKRAYTEEIGGRFLTRIRIAETRPGITRVVLYLTEGTQATTSRLINPERLIVELKAAPPAEEAAPAAPSVISAVPPSLPPVVAETVPPVPTELPARPTVKAAVQIAQPEPAPVSEPALAAKTELPQLYDNAPAPPGAPPAARAAPDGPGRPARHTSDGDNSLVRALGLKINRVVIDPGHGGHDQGTAGPKGLLEKDLVLDVGLRLGKLIQQRMGAEVIYTRTDDTFIPLEGRTQLANDKKADLFLSIHANSSPEHSVTGIETYYLNFTQSKDALDVAARENASSQKTVFELQDLIQNYAA